MEKIGPLFTAVTNFYFHKISYICLYSNALCPLAIASFVMGSGGCDRAYVAFVTPGFSRSQHQGDQCVETSRVITWPGCVQCNTGTGVRVGPLLVTHVSTRFCYVQRELMTHAVYVFPDRWPSNTRASHPAM